jgi:hypothetical protein
MRAADMGYHFVRIGFVRFVNVLYLILVCHIK